MEFDCLLCQRYQLSVKCSSPSCQAWLYAGYGIRIAPVSKCLIFIAVWNQPTVSLFIVVEMVLMTKIVTHEIRILNEPNQGMIFWSKVFFRNYCDPLHEWLLFTRFCLKAKRNSCLSWNPLLSKNKSKMKSFRRVINLRKKYFFGIRVSFEPTDGLHKHCQYAGCFSNF